jgi:hypothetical protein
MWVMVDGDRTQVVTTLGAREGVFVEVAEDRRPRWAVVQERNGKGNLVTRTIELTEELRRVVENAEFVDRDEELRIVWMALEDKLSAACVDNAYDASTTYGDNGAELRELIAAIPAEDADLMGALRKWAQQTAGAKMSAHAEGSLVRLSVSCPLPIRAKSSADKPQMSAPGVSVQEVAQPVAGRLEWGKLSLNDMRALWAAPMPLTLPAGDRLAGLQKLRDHMDAEPTASHWVSKELLAALIDNTIMAERTATYLEERNEAPELDRLRAEVASRQLEVDNLRAALAEHETKLAQASGRNRIHSMDREPPEDGVYVVWQKWPAETPLAGVAPTLRTFAGGRWSARGGSDAGWSSVPKGVL